MAQTSILGRVSQLVRANINAILDGAEDPEKMLDQLVRDFTDNIAEAEDAVAQTIGNLRLIEDDARRPGPPRPNGSTRRGPPRAALTSCARRATPPRPTGSTTWPRSPSVARSSYESQATQPRDAGRRPDRARRQAQGRPQQAARQARGAGPEAGRAGRPGEDGPGPAPGPGVPPERVGHGSDERDLRASRSASGARKRRSAVARRSRRRRSTSSSQSLESDEDEVEVEARLAELKAGG